MYLPGQTTLNPVEIIAEFYDTGSMTYRLLLNHGRQVAQKALRFAARVPHLKPDTLFIREAAMLHDIGIFMTNTPALGCTGEHPYICHGYLGRNLLEQSGLPKHALVCERHVGAGISVADIERQGLPLPLRNMLPVSIEEQIICYADKFFSKLPEKAPREYSAEEILRELTKFGPDKADRFQQWAKMFDTA
ncbi:MAG: phosphohydrolase [Desulfobacterales bacterium]|nr:phosphohydrolase [Desulfobacterales bacterium]